MVLISPGQVSVGVVVFSSYPIGADGADWESVISRVSPASGSLPMTHDDTSHRLSDKVERPLDPRLLLRGGAAMGGIPAPFNPDQCRWPGRPLSLHR